MHFKLYIWHRFSFKTFGMKKNILQILISVLFLFSACITKAGTLENIAAAIQVGNSSELSKYFDTNIDITLFNKEDMYSKIQAELIVKDFFQKNPPTSFKIIHKGASNQGSEYAIGSLITSFGSFRTYIYLKQKENNSYIQEIRFEKD